VCNETACQYCNEEGTECFVYSYGYKYFDSGPFEGLTDSWTDSFQYVKGNEPKFDKQEYNKWYYHNASQETKDKWKKSKRDKCAQLAKAARQAPHSTTAMEAAVALEAMRLKDKLRKRQVQAQAPCSTTAVEAAVALEAKRLNGRLRQRCSQAQALARAPELPSQILCNYDQKRYKQKKTKTGKAKWESVGGADTTASHSTNLCKTQQQQQAANVKKLTKQPSS